MIFMNVKKNIYEFYERKSTLSWLVKPGVLYEKKIKILVDVATKIYLKIFIVKLSIYSFIFTHYKQLEVILKLKRM